LRLPQCKQAIRAKSDAADLDLRINFNHEANQNHG